MVVLRASPGADSSRSGFLRWRIFDFGETGNILGDGGFSFFGFLQGLEGGLVAFLACWAAWGRSTWGEACTRRRVFSGAIPVDQVFEVFAEEL